MDDDVVARLTDGCARIAWRLWPGAPDLIVGIRTLTESQWHDARAHAKARAQRGDERQRAYLESRAERRALIARCIVVRHGDGVRQLLTESDVEGLDDATCADLFRDICTVRDESHGIAEFTRFDTVVEQIDRYYDEKLMSGAVMRIRARAAGLCGFYGVTNARDLTDWQVVIHARLVREKDD